MPVIRIGSSAARASEAAVVAGKPGEPGRQSPFEARRAPGRRPPTVVADPWFAPGRAARR
jgi:hypothetical protein